MDLSQLAKLGVSLPPSTAFGVDLSSRDANIILLWLIDQLSLPRAVRSSRTEGKTVTSAASVIFAASENARPFAMQNNSDTLNVWLAIGATATTTVGIKVPPNGYYESPFDFKEAVSAISTGTAQITILNSVR